MSYETELKFAKDLAEEAGTIMSRYFRAEDIATEWKEDNTPLTIADTKINSLVIERVKQEFPQHGVLGEEESFKPERDMIWVVDPIDGTIPFSLSMPVSTFSLALVERGDGQPVIGVAYDPFLQNLYHAVKGSGSFQNGKRLKTSDMDNFSNTYVTLYGLPVETDTIDYSPGRLSDKFKLKTLGARTINISSEVYTAVKIASGEFAIMSEAGGKPWDTAAAALIVEEAGGVATDLEGKKRRFDEHGLGCVLAANPVIHAEFMKLIQKT